jgi:hypothetical protein
MNKFKIFVLSFFGCGPLAFGAAPSFKFENNRDRKSLFFTMSNPTQTDISCQFIEISADVGKNGCTEILETYQYSQSNIRIEPQTNITNPNFGIDFVHYIGLKEHSTSVTFCGTPLVKVICR